MFNSESLEAALTSKLTAHFVELGFAPLQDEMELHEIITDIKDMVAHDDDLSPETKPVWEAALIAAATQLKNGGNN